MENETFTQVFKQEEPLEIFDCHLFDGNQGNYINTEGSYYNQNGWGFQTPSTSIWNQHPFGSYAKKNENFSVDGQALGNQSMSGTRSDSNWTQNLFGNYATNIQKLPVHNTALGDQIVPNTYTGSKKFRCKVCHKEYLTQKSLDAHVGKKHPLKCGQCGSTFTTSKRLNKHYLEKHASQEVACQICHKDFENPIMLDNHLIADHGYHQCPICPNFYSKKISLQAHIRTKHPMKCGHCSETFESMKLLSYHMAEKHTANGIICYVCNERLDDEFSMDDHMTTLHKYVKCKICSKYYSSKIALQYHMSNHPPKCEVCKESFTSQQQFKQHLSEKHSTVRCNACSETFADQNLYKSHLTTVHKYVQCKICSKTYPVKKSLENHVANKHPSICDLCGIPFPSKKKLNEHLSEKHPTEERKCEICNEALANQAVLESHLINTHKFHQCEICAKLYRSKEAWRVHRHQKHPLKCEQCDMTFIKKAQLKEHCLENHATQNPRCSICNEAFEKPIFFHSHMVVMHQFVQCQICPETYVGKSLLAAHMNRCHPLKCEHCDSVCRTRQDLYHHLSAEHSIKIGKCHCCGSIFLNQYSLERHMEEKHKGNIDQSSTTDHNDVGFKEIGKYECCQKGAFFKTFNGLEYHKKEPSLCSEETCEKTSIPKMEITEGPIYQCSICTAVFELSDDLEKHSKYHIKQEINYF